MSNKFEQISASLRSNSSRWLVTGAAGFIGSHLTEELLRLGQAVVALDNLSTGYRHNLDAVRRAVGDEASKRLTFIEGDVRDAATCAQALSGVSYVLHQAALGSVPRSIETPLVSHASNVDGFITLLEAARIAKVRRFVYASSSSVYGDSPTLPKREGDVGKLLSPYAATKAINEVYAQVWGSVYGLGCVGLRYFNVFGPRQDPKGAYAAVVPCWLSNALAGKACTINGDGATSRDFCYVANVVQANLLSALTSSVAAGEVFNVAVGEQNTLRQLHDLIWEACFQRRLIKESVAPTIADFRRGDIRHSLADISKAQHILGYEPLVRLQQGVEMLVAGVAAVITQ